MGLAVIKFIAGSHESGDVTVRRRCRDRAGADLLDRPSCRPDLSAWPGLDLSCVTRRWCLQAGAALYLVAHRSAAWRELDASRPR